MSGVVKAAEIGAAKKKNLSKKPSNRKKNSVLAEPSVDFEKSQITPAEPKAVCFSDRENSERYNFKENILDPEKFEFARVAGLAHLHNREGIGTLGERSLHSIIKFWVEPDSKAHEISLGVGRIVADVFDGSVVTEIQTRNFTSLSKKLGRIIEDYPIHIIYPMHYTKSIVWVEPETGEMSNPRKSPKRGKIWDCFHELCSIRQFLGHPNLKITVVFLDMDEYKLLNGWGNGGKRGSHRIERIPTAYVSQRSFGSLSDFKAMLIDELPNLPKRFSIKEFSKETKLTLSRASRAVYTLYTAGVIARPEKRGNSFLYEIK